MSADTRGTSNTPSQLLDPMDIASRHQAVAWRVFGPGKFHAALGDERAQQSVHRFHDGTLARELERAVALDRTHSVLLDVAGDDSRKCAAQIGGALVDRLIVRQSQGTHGGVSDFE